MFFVRETTVHRHDPAMNLAVEETLLRECSGEPIFLLWRNRPSVIIGRNQSAQDEVNLPEAERRGIPVVRRCTGGGAVFHDLQTLNYSFLIDRADCDALKPDLRFFARPILDAIQNLGLPCRFSGRNDLLVDSPDGPMKFSGTASRHLGGRFLHHGTILFATDFEPMAALLTPDRGKLRAHAVASVRSRVANLAPLLPEGLTIEDFAQCLRKQVERSFGGSLSCRDLRDAEVKNACRLRGEKYGTKAWNLGRGAGAAGEGDLIIRRRRFPWGGVTLTLTLRGGLIERGEITGDFFAADDPAILVTPMIGRAFTPLGLADAQSDALLKRVFPDLDAEQWRDFLFG
ncbi:MAG: lipoate--protein ligase [Thermoguttaceae bacterium]|nr:lipoate--protein ligase [Thermoguttaceae bacterium]